MAPRAGGTIDDLGNRECGRYHGADGGHHSCILQGDAKADYVMEECKMKEELSRFYKWLFERGYIKKWDGYEDIHSIDDESVDEIIEDYIMEEM